MKNLFEPVELIEPISLLSDADNESEIIIYCRNPGYICKIGKDIPPD